MDEGGAASRGPRSGPRFGGGAAPWTLLAIAFALYVPHIADEALTGMYDDPMMVRALAPFAELSPRHAAYLTFQLMMLLAFAMTLAFARPGKPRLAVLGLVAATLVGEAHHVIRAVATLQTNSGLFTSLPMPLFGVYLLTRVRAALRDPRRTLPQKDTSP